MENLVMFRFARTNAGARPSSRRRAFQPAMETLEDRCVPATTAGLDGSALWIIGDNGNQHIVVTELDTPGSYKVWANDLAGGAEVFSGVTEIHISTGAGADTVNLRGIDNAFLAGGLFITGDGRLTVTDNHFNDGGNFSLQDTSNRQVNFTIFADSVVGDLSVEAGNADNTIILGSGVVVEGSTSINLGNGDNTVRFRSNVVLNGGLDLVAGPGSNDIAFNGVEVGRDASADVNLDLAGGHANVRMLNTTVNGNVNIGSGDLRLTLTIQDCQLHGDVMLGGFAVRANVDSNTAIDGQLNFTTNGGRDSVDVTDTQIGGDFIVTSGVGNNRVVLNSTTIDGDAAVESSGQGTFKAFGSIFNGSLSVDFHLSPVGDPATITLARVTVEGDMTLMTGSSNAVITLRNSEIGQAGTSAYILCGDGNDHVYLGRPDAPVTFFASDVTVDGGGGFNVLHDANADFPNTVPNIINFDVVDG
jgi:hypothetical protein